MFRNILDKIVLLESECYAVEKCKVRHEEKSVYDYFVLESEAVQNKLIPINTKGILCDISKELRKHKDDVANEMYIEIPEIVMVKPKNLVKKLPNLD